MTSAGMKTFSLTSEVSSACRMKPTVLRACRWNCEKAAPRRSTDARERPEGRAKRRFKKTTDSAHAGPVTPNVLGQDFAAGRSDQKWGADISYIWTAEGWLYLAHPKQAVRG